MNSNASRRPRRTATLVGLVGLGLVGVAGRAGATAPTSSPAPGQPVAIVVHSTDGVDDAFEADIAGCESGTTSDGSFVRRLTRTHGVFNGSKEFTCSDGAGGFTVHLNASFTFTGSTGTWSVRSSWGSLAGMRGQGKLVGIVIEGGAGIDDRYDGWVDVT